MQHLEISVYRVFFTLLAIALVCSIFYVLPFPLIVGIEYFIAFVSIDCATINNNVCAASAEEQRKKMLKNLYIEIIFTKKKNHFLFDLTGGLELKSI